MEDTATAEKIAELNRLLATCTYGRVIGKLPRFLKKKGVTDRLLLKGDGWMRVLANMVPGEYGTLDDLLQAVKDS